MRGISNPRIKSTLEEVDVNGVLASPSHQPDHLPTLRRRTNPTQESRQIRKLNHQNIAQEMTEVVLFKPSADAVGAKASADSEPKSAGRLSVVKDRQAEVMDEADLCRCVLCLACGVIVACCLLTGMAGRAGVGVRFEMLC